MRVSEQTRLSTQFLTLFQQLLNVPRSAVVPPHRYGQSKPYLCWFEPNGSRFSARIDHWRPRRVVRLTIWAGGRKIIHRKKDWRALGMPDIAWRPGAEWLEETSFEDIQRHRVELTLVPEELIVVVPWLAESFISVARWARPGPPCPLPIVVPRPYVQCPQCDPKDFMAGFVRGSWAYAWTRRAWGTPEPLVYTAEQVYNYQRWYLGDSLWQNGVSWTFCHPNPVPAIRLRPRDKPELTWS